MAPSSRLIFVERILSNLVTGSFAPGPAPRFSVVPRGCRAQVQLNAAPRVARRKRWTDRCIFLEGSRASPTTLLMSCFYSTRFLNT